MTVPAAAQRNPSRPRAGAATAEESKDLGEARSRFRRAVELYDEANYESALLEFQRAYELAPHPRLFYNIGKVADKLRDYPAAYEAFTKYLEQNPDDISAERREEVVEAIRRLEGRTALLTIQVNVPGAEITLDDARVFTAPLDTPIRVNSGRHTIRVTASGYSSSFLPFEVVGKDHQTYQVTLDRIEAPTVPVVSLAQLDKPSRPLPWLWYGVTGGLATATVITGLIANSKAQQYDDLQRDQNTREAADLDSAFNKLRMWTITTDVLLGGTLVAAGIATYKTIVPPSKATTEKTVAALSWSGGNDVQILVTGLIP
jgi:tetratricopeptide (TPR) repeat protein